MNPTTEALRNLLDALQDYRKDGWLQTFASDKLYTAHQAACDQLMKDDAADAAQDEEMTRQETATLAQEAKAGAA